MRETSNARRPFVKRMLPRLGTSYQMTLTKTLWVKSVSWAHRKWLRSGSGWTAVIKSERSTRNITNLAANSAHGTNRSSLKPRASMLTRQDSWNWPTRSRSKSMSFRTIRMMTTTKTTPTWPCRGTRWLKNLTRQNATRKPVPLALPSFSTYALKRVRSQLLSRLVSSLSLS